jgi:hypothetical protein
MEDDQMKRYLAYSALALALAGCGGNPSPADPTAMPAAAAAAAPVADPAAAAAATITPDDMYERIAFLASDELRGRDTPSPGLDTAAAYIAREFESFGLSPAGDDGSFIQRWQYAQTTFDRSATGLTLSAGGTVVNAEIGRQFFTLPAMGAESASGAMTWTGAASAGRTLATDGISGTFATLYLPGTEPDVAWQTNLQGAIGGVIGGGPSGIVVILDPGFPSGMISQIASQLINQPAPFFLVGLDYASAQQLFTAAGQDLDALRAASNEAVPLEGATLEVRVKKVSQESTPPNVVATLMGSDSTLRNEYVVFSAHMDHVGVGAPDATGDSIFNGADDDASGTATMLEVAEAFASLPTRPARSMIFLAVSGEEKGLLGSAAFAANPPVPIEQLVANINLDMVGRNAPDSIIAIGNEYSSLGALVQEVATAHSELGLTIAPDLQPEERLFFRSDHFNFAKAGVPAIFFTTGLHDQYHKQADEVELIDTDKISRIGRLVFHLALEIATQPTAPTWTAKGIAEVQPANVSGR